MFRFLNIEGRERNLLKKKRCLVSYIPVKKKDVGINRFTLEKRIQ
jgi:hypothetical protein